MPPPRLTARPRRDNDARPYPRAGERRTGPAGPWKPWAAAISDEKAKRAGGDLSPGACGPRARCATSTKRAVHLALCLPPGFREARPPANPDRFRPGPFRQIRRPAIGTNASSLHLDWSGNQFLFAGLVGRKGAGGVCIQRTAAGLHCCCGSCKIFIGRALKSGYRERGFWHDKGTGASDEPLRGLSGGVMNFAGDSVWDRGRFDRR